MNKPILPERVPASGKPSIILIYDGQCPVCSAYSRIARIRKDLGGIQLVDARIPSAFVDEITDASLNLDEGMVLKVGGRLYHGAEATHMLALLSTERGWLNRLNRRLFGSPRVANVIYPIARALRGLLLKLLGRRKIDNLGKGSRMGDPPRGES